MAKAKQVWRHPSKKKGFGRSTGSYNVWRGDRYYTLTTISEPKKTRRYESPQAAARDGWVKE
ncbi:hypothetical protein UFOVP558_44 [uncultured Caudovirales phage]|uniref:Uncharacterized protein n=1 Tax=uncultured Caudovirales phage TaxID=2100421 RepID=A0A6J5MSX5_9CAUD|nr:hypothetical protein UFOVP558_44 [uncultured Caudovirales phage]